MGQLYINSVFTMPLQLQVGLLHQKATQYLTHVLEVSMQAVTFYSDTMDVLWWVCSVRLFVVNRIEGETGGNISVTVATRDNRR